MKRLFTLLLGLVSAASIGAEAPTPDSVMAFHLDKDPRTWTSQFQNQSKGGLIMESVPKGDLIKTWTEMMTHQIAFTTESLRKFVDSWKGVLQKADPKIDIKEETLTDGSVLAAYTSPFADEISMRRFMKGKDGVYMLAYHVRPKLKQAETFKTWAEILRTATLIPNPEKKKKK